MEYRGHNRISIFLGAVLLLSVALSYLAFDLVQQVATARTVAANARKSSENGMVESELGQIEEELSHHVRVRAQEVAHLAGRERTSLPGVFQSLELVTQEGNACAPFAELAAQAQAEGKDIVYVGSSYRTQLGLRFAPDRAYVHRLIREHFATEFHPGQAWIARVTERDGSVVYESAPAPGGGYDVTRQRRLQRPGFGGLTVSLSYRGSSREPDVDTWKTRTLGLIGLLEVMLGAGLLLAYRNARHERLPVTAFDGAG